jgi:hypothetical protein
MQPVHPQILSREITTVLDAVSPSWHLYSMNYGVSRADTHYTRLWRE